MGRTRAQIRCILGRKRATFTPFPFPTMHHFFGFAISSFIKFLACRSQILSSRGFTNRDVTLTLSKHDTLKTISYVGIWCKPNTREGRRQGRSQGHVAIPRDLNVPAFIETPYYGAKIGDLGSSGVIRQETDRALGSVYAADQDFLVIADFTFDGRQQGE